MRKGRAHQPSGSHRPHPGLPQVKTEQAFVGAVVADSLPYSIGGTALHATGMRTQGIDCFVGYLGAMNATRLKQVLDAGMAFMPVTFGGEYEDGPLDEVAQLRALGIPSGTSVWLDMEGLKAFRTDPRTLIGMIDLWADGIIVSGWMPCLYVGVPQPLTSEELWRLRVQRYWRGQGSVRDRNNALAEPTGCGWCMDQKFPSVTRGGTLVDMNMIGQDFKKRTPTWCRA